MALIDNLSQGQLNSILYRLRRLENASPMNNGAVGRSGFEVYDGGTINISSGNLIGAGTFIWQGAFNQSGTTTFSGATTIAGPTGITGALTVQGDTSVTGPFTATGDTKLNGPTTIAGNTTVTGDTKLNGPTHINGATDIAGNVTATGTFTNNGPVNVNGAMKTTGTLSVEGATTLKNDLTVAAGKRILVGGLSLENTGSGGGQLNLPTGSLTASAAFGALLNSTVAVEIAAPTIKLTGLPSTSGVTPNVYMDGNGILKKII